MRTDLLWAGGLAALAIAMTAALVRAVEKRAEDKLVNAIAITAVVLREAPSSDARATGYVAPGGTAIVDSTGADGWIYATTATGQGYAVEEAFAMMLREEVPG